MTGIESYFFSIIVTGLICCIIQSMAPKSGTTAAILKLAVGIVLSVTILGPTVKLKLDQFVQSTDEIVLNASNVVSQGERSAEQAISSIIKERTEAYILDKAELLGAVLRVNVMISPENLIPCAVIIDGTVSPYVKKRIMYLLRDELGITEENQTWTG